MNFLLAFVFGGVVCGVAEIIYDHSKLTAGHITSLFVVLGAIVAGLNLYQPLIDIFGGGAIISITNYGALLVKGGLEGMEKEGLLGIFKYLMLYTSSTLTVAILSGIVGAAVIKPKP